MEFLILMGIVCALSGPVGLVVAILAYRRSGRLQRELWRAPHRPPAAQGVATETHQPVPRPAATQPAAPSQPAPRSTPPQPTPPQPTPPSRRPPAKRTSTDFEAILGGQWLTWAGVLALFFGTAFFLGVDLGENVLSGLPQVLIGLAVAAVFGVVGHKLSSRPERFLGLGLLGGAVALLFLAMFAAYGFHRLVPLPVVFPLLLAVATVGALLALNHNSLTIAALTLVGAVLTPIILIDLADDRAAFDALLPYLVAVNLGAVLVGLRRGWAGLPLGSFLSTLVLVTAWWEAHPRADLFAFLSVTGSWLVFAAAPWLRRAGNRFWSFARAGILATNGLAYALFCHTLLADAGKNAQGGALLGLAGFYFVLSAQMKKRQGASPATRLSHTAGAALAGLAVPVLFDMTWVTVGWTALAGILVMAGLRERDFWQRLTGMVVLLIGVARSALVDIPVTRPQTNAFQPLLNGEFLAGLAALGLLGWTFWAYHRYADRLHRLELRGRPLLLVVGLAVLLWKLSFEVVGHFIWREKMPGLGSGPDVWLWLLLLWTIYGLAALLGGLRTRYLALRGPGYVILGLATVATVLSSISAGVHLVEVYRPVFNLPLLQGAGLAAALGILAWRLTRTDSGLLPVERRLRTPVLVTAILVLFVKVSLEVIAFFELGSAVAAANQALKSQLTLSVVWGLYAGIVIGIGFARRFKPVRLLGMSLLGLTVLKVFFVDMQELARGYRIAAFVALGLLLLAVSLLYQRERRSTAETED